MSTIEPTTAEQRRLLRARALHWRRTRRLTCVLLLLGFGTTFCTVFFARELAAISVAGWPLSFYLAAQGACLIYLLILGLYARSMRRLDRQFALRIAHAAGTGA